jgi:hypothetical protein
VNAQLSTQQPCAAFTVTIYCKACSKTDNSFWQSALSPDCKNVAFPHWIRGVFSNLILRGWDVQIDRDCVVAVCPKCQKGGAS